MPEDPVDREKIHLAPQARALSPQKRWSAVLCLFLSLWGCPVSQIRQPQGPCCLLQKQGRSSLFTDRRTGLSFRVPPETKLDLLSLKGSPQGFEARLLLQDRGLEIRVRKDRLPPDLPEGALSAPWLLRYVEAYARRHTTKSKQLTSRMLTKKQSRHFRAHAGAWASFPNEAQPPFAWEEVLVLARSPDTRYLLSIRISQEERQRRKWALRQFMALFLRHLRLSPQTTPH